jgi:hypothetical protein
VKRRADSFFVNDEFRCFFSSEFKCVGEISLKLLKKPKMREIGFIIGKFANKIGSSHGKFLLSLATRRNKGIKVI